MSAEGCAPHSTSAGPPQRGNRVNLARSRAAGQCHQGCRTDQLSRSAPTDHLVVGSYSHRGMASPAAIIDRRQKASMALSGDHVMSHPALAGVVVAVLGCLAVGCSAESPVRPDTQPGGAASLAAKPGAGSPGVYE